MNLKVLGISASPRFKGNSDLLLREALAGAESAGAQVEYIRLCDLNIAPCIECNSCYSTGRCSIEDDYQLLAAKMLDVDRLLFATPVFFMTVCAQAKLLIDRCQCLWAHKNVLKEPGGSRGKKMFGCIRLTMKSYFDVLDMHYSAGLFVSNVDALGEIKKHPSAMTDAFHLGHQLVITTAPPPEKPTDIELT